MLAEMNINGHSHKDEYKMKTRKRITLALAGRLVAGMFGACVSEKDTDETSTSAAKQAQSTMVTYE